MKKFYLILIKFLIISSICKADVVPGSEWKVILGSKSSPLMWLVDLNSIVKADGKNNFYFLHLKASNKTLVKGKNAKTILFRDQIDCDKKLRRPNLAQVYDIKMENGLTNKGKTLFTQKFNEDEKWVSTEQNKIDSKIASVICLRNMGMNFSEDNDPERQKKLKEFLKKKGIKTGTNN